MWTGQSRYGDGHSLSVPAVRKDDTRVSVEFTIVPFTDDAGRMIGIAAILRDAVARFEGCVPCAVSSHFIRPQIPESISIGYSFRRSEL